MKYKYFVIFYVILGSFVLGNLYVLHSFDNSNQKLFQCDGFFINYFDVLGRTDRLSLRLALNAESENEYEHAACYYRKTLEADTSHLRARLNLARLELLVFEDFEVAKKEVKLLGNLSPDLIEYKLLSTYINLIDGQLNLAKTTLDKTPHHRWYECQSHGFRLIYYLLSHQDEFSIVSVDSLFDDSLLLMDSLGYILPNRSSYYTLDSLIYNDAVEAFSFRKKFKNKIFYIEKVLLNQIDSIEFKSYLEFAMEDRIELLTNSFYESLFLQNSKNKRINDFIKDYIVLRQYILLSQRDAIKKRNVSSIKSNSSLLKDYEKRTEAELETMLTEAKRKVFMQDMRGIRFFDTYFY